MIKKGRLQKSEQPAWLHALLCFCLVALGLRAPHWPLGEALDQGEVESWGFWKDFWIQKVEGFTILIQVCHLQFRRISAFCTGEAALVLHPWPFCPGSVWTYFCHLTEWIWARDVAFCRISEDNTRISAKPCHDDIVVVEKCHIWKVSDVWGESQASDFMRCNHGRGCPLRFSLHVGWQTAARTCLEGLGSEYIATWGERLTPCCTTPFACPALIFLWPVPWLCVDDTWTETSFFMEHDRYEQTRRIYILYLYIYIIDIYSIVYTRPLLQLTRGTIRLDLKGRAERCMDIYIYPLVNHSNIDSQCFWN